MKNKTGLTIAIVFILVVGIIIANNIYENKMGMKKVICDFVVEYSNYDEQLTFIFKENEIVEYYRNEKFYGTEDQSADELYAFFKEKTDKVEDRDTFKYTSYKKNNVVYIDTYINAKEESDMFKDYVGGLGLQSDLSPEAVIDHLNSTNYKCKLK